MPTPPPEFPRVGLVVNPIAGMGGEVALKGTDGVLEEARSRGATPRSNDRAMRCIRTLLMSAPTAQVLAGAGEMGADACRASGVSPVVEVSVASPSTSADTRQVARAMLDHDVDLLLIVGGDGTATDVHAAIGTELPVLGVPAGVKVQSGIFARSPEAAGVAAGRFALRSRRHTTFREVMDLDEEQLRGGVLAPRVLGRMAVPAEVALLQNPKSRGMAGSSALDALGAGIAQTVSNDSVVAVGPGATAGALLRRWGMEHTLLGFDVVEEGHMTVADADADALLAYADRMHLVIAPVGGQGFLFGRGNQQLNAEVLNAFSPERLRIVATPDRLVALKGQPLLIDIDDRDIAQKYTGIHRIQTGPQRWTMHEVAAPDFRSLTHNLKGTS